jgi:hypothetical protein
MNHEDFEHDDDEVEDSERDSDDEELDDEGPLIFPFDSIAFDPTAVDDAADYFITVMTEEFPLLEAESFQANEWRRGWVIKIPRQFDRPVRDVENKAIEIRDKLYWEKSILLPFAIEALYEEKEAIV